jgi:ribosomal protein S18 acetylase RimI-like enzyme
MASWGNKRKLVAPNAAKQIDPSQVRKTRNFTWSPDALAAFAEQHPELDARDGDDVVLGWPLGEQLTVYYSFEDPEGLRKGFAGLFEELEAGNADRFKRLYLYFDDHPNRPFIEPVLRQSAFEVIYEMVYLVREDLSSMPRPSDIKPATEADIESIIALDSACYEAARLAVADIKELIARGDKLFTLRRGEELVGYVYVRREDEMTGHVARLGVRPDARREGNGYTLLTQALGVLRDKGCVRVTTLAPVDRKAAVDLCKKAGFAPRHTVLLYAKEPGAKVKKTLGLIGLRGIWER